MCIGLRKRNSFHNWFKGGLCSVILNYSIRYEQDLRFKYKDYILETKEGTPHPLM